MQGEIPRLAHSFTQTIQLKKHGFQTPKPMLKPKKFKTKAFYQNPNRNNLQPKLTYFIKTKQSNKSTKKC